MELLKAQHAEQLRLQREEQERALESLRRSQEQILSQQLSEFREQLRSAQNTPRAREPAREPTGELRRTDLGLSATAGRQIPAAEPNLPRKSPKVEVSAPSTFKTEKFRQEPLRPAGKSVEPPKVAEPTEVGVNRRAHQFLIRQGGRITARLPLAGATAVVSADRTRVRIHSGTQEVSVSVDPATAAAMRAQLTECGCRVQME